MKSCRICNNVIGARIPFRGKRQALGTPYKVEALGMYSYRFPDFDLYLSFCKWVIFNFSHVLVCVCTQVDRGVPFSMASSLKERADEAASAETERLEAKEASIKKTCKDEVGWSIDDSRSSLPTVCNSSPHSVLSHPISFHIAASCSFT